MTQAEATTRRLCFSSTTPALVHFSYRRYLETQLRQAFGFEGTPIRMVFRSRRGRLKLAWLIRWSSVLKNRAAGPTPIRRGASHDSSSTASAVLLRHATPSVFHQRSHWTGAAIIVQSPRETCIVPRSRTRIRPMPSSSAG